MLAFLILLTSILTSLAAIIPRATCEVSLTGSTVSGTEANGGCRYVVEYAEASRWGQSTLVTSFGGHTSTSLPPACPQASSFYVNAGQSEDCLWNTIYTPTTAPPSPGLPVLVWIHGGSSLTGSASAPGLNGTHLATTGNIIVVVIQYRLGVLGFIPPTQAPTSSDPNLGLQDIIHALQSVHDNIAAFGGDPSKVTVGGQSSGGQMIRALLGAPSAAGLFRAGIIQSDPMIYGFAPTTTTSQLQNYLYTNTQLSDCNTLACLQAVSVDELLSAQATLNQNAPYMFTGVPFSLVIRPTFGTTTLPSDPTPALFGDPSTLSTSNIPLIITTVRNEGGQAVQQLFSSPIAPNNSTYFYTLTALVGGTARAAEIGTSAQYALPASAPSGSDIFRETFELATTDGTWRCPNRDVASHWAGAGNDVWVGEWEQGETYPSNQGGNYCTASGRVCHEDDLYPTFGTGTDSTLESQLSSYWISFITSLNPGSDWQPYSSSDTGTQGIKAIGGGDVVGCPGDLWGNAIEYDWKLYG